MNAHKRSVFPPEWKNSDVVAQVLNLASIRENRDTCTTATDGYRIEGQRTANNKTIKITTFTDGADYLNQPRPGIITTAYTKDGLNTSAQIVQYFLKLFDAR